MQSASSSTLGSTLPRRLRVLIVGGGLSTSRLLPQIKKSTTHFCFISGGLTLANGLLNAAPFVPLDITVFEKDQVEYLKERGGYQIRVSLINPSLILPVDPITARSRRHLES